MELKSQTDHIALLSLTMVGLLIKRLDELRQLDEPTRKHLHRLIDGVRVHADNHGHTDLKILFDNIDKSLAS